MGHLPFRDSIRGRGAWHVARYVQGMLMPWLTDEEEERIRLGIDGEILLRALMIGHRVWLLIARMMQGAELTLNEARILLHMNGAAAWQNPADIANAISVARSSVSRALERLERRGLMKHLGRSVEDRRFMCFALTEEGQSFAERARRLLEITGGETLVRWPQADRESIARGLQLLDRHLRDVAVGAEWVLPRPRPRAAVPERPPFRARTPTPTAPAPEEAPAPRPASLLAEAEAFREEIQRLLDGDS